MSGTWGEIFGGRVHTTYYVQSYVLPLAQVRFIDTSRPTSHWGSATQLISVSTNPDLGLGGMHK